MCRDVGKITFRSRNGDYAGPSIRQSFSTGPPQSSAGASDQRNLFIIELHADAILPTIGVELKHDSWLF